MCMRLAPGGMNLMAGYRGDDDCNDLVSRRRLLPYRDLASRDNDDYVTYTRRTGDVFSVRLQICLLDWKACSSSVRR
jgi:hypothetical protein